METISTPNWAKKEIVIYPDTKIGDNFTHGHFVLIRENCSIGDNVSIGSFCDIEDGVTIGDNVRIHSQCFLPRHTVIADNVRIYPGVKFANDKYFLGNGHREGAVVGAFATIGMGAIVLPGVIVGRHAKIGAGAVVTKNVPAGAVVAGNPAREIEQAKTRYNVGMWIKDD